MQPLVTVKPELSCVFLVFMVRPFRLGVSAGGQSAGDRHTGAVQARKHQALWPRSFEERMVAAERLSRRIKHVGARGQSICYKDRRHAEIVDSRDGAQWTTQTFSTR